MPAAVAPPSIRALYCPGVSVAAVDVAAIIACAREEGYNATFLRAIEEANERFRA